MTDFVYDAEARRRDAVIARAMGHYSGTLRFRNGEEKVVWFKPDGTPIEGLPRFHTDRDALAEALAWCAENTERWNAFTYALFGQIKVVNFDYVQAALLAPTHVKAWALAEAIGGERTVPTTDRHGLPLVVGATYRSSANTFVCTNANAQPNDQCFEWRNGETVLLREVGEWRNGVMYADLERVEDAGEEER